MSRLPLTPTLSINFAETARSMGSMIATRDRRPDFFGMGMYLPNPDPILRRLGKRIEVYRELRSDAHTGGCIRRRKAAVQALEVRVEQGKASEQTTRLITDWIDTLNMPRLIAEILDATLFGYQPMEVMWQDAGAGVLPVDVVGKPPEWFVFDTDANIRFLSKENPMKGDPYLPRKFVVAAQDASYANPYGFADLSMCFWPVTFKKGGLRYWVKFAEKYGMPWAVGKQPRNSPKDESGRLLDQLEAMIEDAVAVIPDDASVEMIQATGSSGNADAYEKLLMFCRSEVAIALLGQNQSTEASATNASATAGLDVAAGLRDADARIVEEVFNQLARWITDLRDGEGAPAPYLVLWEPEEVSKLQAERDEVLTRVGVKFTREYFKRVYDLNEDDIEAVPVIEGEGGATPMTAMDPEVINAFSMGIDRFVRMGFNVDQDFIYDAFGIPRPRAGATLLTPPATEQATPMFAEGPPAAQPADDVVDALAPVADSIVKQWINTIADMLDKSSSLEDFQKRLLGAFDALPEKELVEVMGLALTAARLRGMDAAQKDE